MKSYALHDFRLPPNPGIATVVCSGDGHMITQIPPLEREFERCVGDCMLVHEYVHMDDLNKLGVGQKVCKGQPKGTLVTIPGGAGRGDSERRGYEAELECLKKKTCDSNNCRDAALKRIDNLKRYNR